MIRKLKFICGSNTSLQETHHDIGLWKVTVTWKLARPTSEITSRVWYTNVTSILWTKVRHFWRELENEIFQRHMLLVRLFSRFLIHIRARVIYVSFAKFLKVDQIIANPFFIHCQFRRHFYSDQMCSQFHRSNSPMYSV